MILTEKRSEILANYLLADNSRTQKLLEMTPEEATKAINVDGNDFTIEEIKEFGRQLQLVAACQNDGELAAEALNNINGGVVISAAVLAAGVALFGAGLTFGYNVAKDRGWHW